jgi:hypothetical protein
MGAENSNYDNQFYGNLNDVAIFNYALSASQVLNQYISAGVPASVLVQPTNTVVGQNGTATFSATVIGTPPLTLQWYNENNQAIAGATNTTLVLSDVPASDNGSSYYLTAINEYNNGVPAQSQSATLAVISGLPQITLDVPSEAYALLGSTQTIAVTAVGTEPISCQWEFNGTNLANSALITGVQSNVLTLADVGANEAGAYQVIAANSLGSATSSVCQFVVAGALPIELYDGVGWTVNPGGSYTINIVTNDMMTLTDTNGGDNWTTAYFDNPQYVGAFRASFTYEDQYGAPINGGAAFVLQNQGLAAVGGGGGGLGYSGITNSVAVALFPSSVDDTVTGYNVSTNGDLGSVVGNTATGNVKLGSGDPINVTLNYAPGQMTLTFTDAVAGTSFSTNLPINIPNAVGRDTAYVGFCGADAGIHASQNITNISFVSIPIAAMQPAAAKTAVISWPGVITGYTLQRSSSLTSPDWVNLTNAVNVVNGQNQVVVPVGGANQFYRLVLNLNP